MRTPKKRPDTHKSLDVAEKAVLRQWIASGAAYQDHWAFLPLERAARFVQILHAGWDHHGGLREGMTRQAAASDQPSAALIKDLKLRGTLDETLVVWGGESGRTAYSQGIVQEMLT